MRVSGTAGRRLAVASGAVLVASAALAAAGGSWAASRAAGSGGGTQTCITVDQLSATSGQQAATARYWTLARMRATAGWSPADAAPARLTPAQARAGQQAAPRASLTRQCSATRSLLAAVPAIPAARAAPSSAGAAPQSTHVISGYRTVGKLFYVTSTGRRASCTGTSISNGHGADLVLTAAHCVAGLHQRADPRLGLRARLAQRHGPLRPLDRGIRPRRRLGLVHRLRAPAPARPAIPTRPTITRSSSSGPGTAAAWPPGSALTAGPWISAPPSTR